MPVQVRSLVLLMAAVAVAGQGCASLTQPAAGVTASRSVDYTLDGVAYRTFSAPVEHLRRATLATFKRLDIALTSDEAKDDGCREVVGVAGDRLVHVELERLTARTTRMRITAKQGWLWRDTATAGEILVQAERTLVGKPALSQRSR